MTFPARRVGLALEWVVRTLDAHEVPYQVVGGLAALAHGGSRPLFDIDLFAPLEGRAALVHSLRPHTVWGPERFTDDVWDLLFMKLGYRGVRIEIGDAASSPRYFDKLRSLWTEQVIDFGASVRRTLYGVPVNVMPVHELIAYKAALGRPVDLQDIRDLVAVQPTSGLDIHKPGQRHT